MSKIKLYVYPHAKPHVHDGIAEYVNTVPLSKKGIEDHFDVVGPNDADYFYMGQLTNNASLNSYNQNSWQFLAKFPEKHICDYEGEGGQEYGAGGVAIPDWLRKSILTINGPLKTYGDLNIFTRPTFSNLLVDIAKNRNEYFSVPKKKSVWFKGLINCTTRQLLTIAMSRFEGELDFELNNKWSGPSQVDSEIQKNYIKKMNDNLISLCPRGSGMDSVRLIETCYYKRVPVLISDHDYFMVGEPGYDTSFCFRIISNDPADILNQVVEIYNRPIKELVERAEAAREYFEDVIRVYFNDPTLTFIKWLKR